MSLITNVHAREILDSRGNPTIEVEVETASGFVGRAMVPSGASTGEREALELRDGDPSRYGGKGVLQAVENVNNILIDVVLGMDVTDQAAIDKALIDADGTKDKSKYGANAILGISCGCTCCCGLLWVATVSLFRRYQCQDTAGTYDECVKRRKSCGFFCGFSGVYDYAGRRKSIREAIRMGAETFHALKKVLKSKGQVTAVGDEGGFAPNLEDNEAPLKCIMEAIEAAGFRAGEDICIAMDVAASEFYNTETKMYDLKKSGQGSKTTDEMIAWYDELVEKYPIISIEDGLGERDWDGWKKLTEHLGKKIQIVGDDLFVTNPAILQEGIDKDIANSILIKVNQIGTLTETFDAMELAKKHGYTAVVSHRSGETEDATIADIAVAFNAGQIKTGSMSRTDRIAKYNQLLRIEEELGDVALFQGKSAFYNIYKH